MPENNGGKQLLQKNSKKKFFAKYSYNSLNIAKGH